MTDKRMTKTDFLEAVTAETAGSGVPVSKAQTRAVINVALALLQRQMTEGGSVVLNGFGTFDTGWRKARQGRNPGTGEPMEIQAARVPKFRAARELRGVVNTALQGG